jgi:hypothetical protein
VVVGGVCGLLFSLMLLGVENPVQMLWLVVAFDEECETTGKVEL